MAEHVRPRAAPAPWLLPVLSGVARAAVHSFYRFDVAGESPPPDGPALFVANHPNSLVDPAFVAACAGRPIRFLAKAPLFTDPRVGWLMRAGGALPVYRRQDDPGLMGRNESTFSVVHAALESGDAVGIFPEGISHTSPGLAELRTGAARIALGASERLGVFPIVPVGMFLREKGRFRSEACAIVGAPVYWDDLAGLPEDHVDAVRDLTGRIEAALRDVTVNVERWEDLPNIECAEAVYAAEMDLARSPDDRVRRMREVSETLAAYRREDPERIDGLYRAVDRFRRALDRVGLRADDLDEVPDAAAATGWFVRRAGLFLLGGPLAAAGAVVFFVPYRLTGWISRQPGLTPDVRSTWKILAGALVYTSWVVLLALVAGVLFGAPVGFLTLLGLPLLALITAGVRDTWVDARMDVRRYLALRSGAEPLERLREHRRVLAESLEVMRRGRAG